jgi:hypothetical protein
MRGDAGVVDENIEAAELSAGRSKGARASSSVGDIASNANRSPTQLRNLLSHFCKPIFAASKQSNIGTMPR